MRLNLMKSEPSFTYLVSEVDQLQILLESKDIET